MTGRTRCAPCGKAGSGTRSGRGNRDGTGRLSGTRRRNGGRCHRQGWRQGGASKRRSVAASVSQHTPVNGITSDNADEPGGTRNRARSVECWSGCILPESRPELRCSTTAAVNCRRRIFSDRNRGKAEQAPFAWLRRSERPSTIQAKRHNRSDRCSTRRLSGSGGRAGAGTPDRVAFRDPDRQRATELRFAVTIGQRHAVQIVSQSDTMQDHRDTPGQARSLAPLHRPALPPPIRAENRICRTLCETGRGHHMCAQPFGQT